MPASTDFQPGPHYLAFAAVKLAGYSAFAAWLNRLYGRPRSVPGVGLARTGLGMAFGALLWWTLGGAGAWLLLGLLAARLVEWPLLFALFYDRRLENRAALARALPGGIATSFLLDIPAALGFFATGGLSIC